MEVRGGGKLQQNIWLETSEKVKHNISSIILSLKKWHVKENEI